LTLIEAYFFRGRVCLPFQNHVAELLRLVVLTLPQITAFGAKDTVGEYGAAIAQAVWDYGGSGARPLQYNCLYAGGGGANYSQTHLGGWYRLGDWLQKLHRYCNCYDLAGIVQLACRALGMRPNPGGVGLVPVSCPPFLDSQFYLEEVTSTLCHLRLVSVNHI